MGRMNLIVCACALSLAITTLASADSVTFSGYSHGQVVADSYGPNDPDLVGTTDGNTVRLEVVNYSFDPDLAVVFDSNGYDYDDPDLAGPPSRTWDTGNLAPHTDLGNMLIIQENANWRYSETTERYWSWSSWKWKYYTVKDYWGDTNDNNLVDVGDIVDADDEAARPAGYVDFFFDQTIDSFGFDLVDVEGAVEYDAAYVATFFDIAGDPITQVLFGDFDEFQNDIEWGDNSANRIDSRSISDWTGGLSNEASQVRIALGGSGAIDNLTFTYAPQGGSQDGNPVPTPTALMAGLGGLAMCIARRRRIR